MSPTTPMRSASRRAVARSCDTMASDSANGGVQQAESPEWMPASSMCSSTPPTYTSSPSQSASRSTSTAPSRKRSRYTG